jgi:hypothetical protein
MEKLAALLGALTLPLAVLDAPVQEQLRVQPDGYALVQGVVLENIRGCERDLPCALRLRVLGQDVRLQYHAGEGGPRCPDALVRQGLAIRPGTPVRAHGFHHLSGKTHLLDLCRQPSSASPAHSSTAADGSGIAGTSVTTAE